MSRPLEIATSEAVGKPVLPLAMIVYLDIADDPLFAWTGIGDLTFGAPELIANGKFDYNLNGWVKGYGDPKAELINNAIRITTVSGSWASHSYSFPTVVGQEYKTSVRLVGTSNGGAHFIKSDSAVDWGVNRADLMPNNTTTPGVYAGKFTATAATSYIHVLGGNAAGSTATYDDISVAEQSAGLTTGDPSLDGKTFKGLGTIAEISNISDGIGGSDAIEIAMPGVDPFQPAMRQLITDRRRWQFRRAVVWMLALDPDTDAIVGKPFRVKTGRMDRMPYTEGRDGGVIKVRIEGQQAYGNEPLNTRYSEQVDLDPNDNSQQWVHHLANITPELGIKTEIPGAGNTGASVSIGGGSGFNGSRNSGGRRVGRN